MTVFGIPHSIPIWVDSRVFDHEWVIVGAGSRSAKIKLDPAQLRDLDRVESVEELAKDAGPS